MFIHAKHGRVRQPGFLGCDLPFPCRSRPARCTQRTGKSWDLLQCWQRHRPPEDSRASACGKSMRVQWSPLFMHRTTGNKADVGVTGPRQSHVPFRTAWWIGLSGPSWRQKSYGAGQAGEAYGILPLPACHQDASTSSVRFRGNLYRMPPPNGGLSARDLDARCRFATTHAARQGSFVDCPPDVPGEGAGVTAVIRPWGGLPLKPIPRGDEGEFRSLQACGL